MTFPFLAHARLARRYCGSCWAHGSVSALGDRIKIARQGKGIDINLSVQHLLNCGNVGSCHGGSVDGPYQWLHRLSATGTGISYETQQPYIACSSESGEGLCSAGDWTCTPENIARTCSVRRQPRAASTALALRRSTPRCPCLGCGWRRVGICPGGAFALAASVAVAHAARVF